MFEVSTIVHIKKKNLKPIRVHYKLTKNEEKYPNFEGILHICHFQHLCQQPKKNKGGNSFCLYLVANKLMNSIHEIDYIWGSIQVVRGARSAQILHVHIAI